MSLTQEEKQAVLDAPDMMINFGAGLADIAYIEQVAGIQKR